jgi:SAM-dependent methyltransferase
MDVGKEFDQWVDSGRDESMERGHFESTMKLFSSISSAISATKKTKNSISEDVIQSAFSNRVVFDVGCGNGWTLRRFLELGGKRGYGCDLSNKMIEKARGYDHFDIEYRVGEIDVFYEDIIKELKIPKMDVCLCIESLYYHSDPQKSVQRFYDILEKEGYVGIMVDLYEESWGTHPWIDALDVDVHLLSIAQYRQLLKNAGFVDIQHSQFQMTSPITTEAEFISNAYWPTYEQYIAYRKAGSLLLFAKKK